MNRDELAQAIIDLENGQFGLLKDEQLAHELGQHLKPLIDQGVSFDTPSPSHRSQETDEALDRDLGPAEPPVRTPVRFDGPTPEIATLSNRERARWIFMERFIPPEQLETIIGCVFSPEESDRINRELDEFLDRLFLLTDVASALNSEG